MLYCIRYENAVAILKWYRVSFSWAIVANGYTKALQCYVFFRDVLNVKRDLGPATTYKLGTLLFSSSRLSCEEQKEFQLQIFQACCILQEKPTSKLCRGKFSYIRLI